MYRVYEMTDKQHILDTLAVGWMPLYFFTEIVQTAESEAAAEIYGFDESKAEWQLQFHIVMGVTWRLDDGKIEFKKCVINDHKEMEDMINHVGNIAKKEWEKQVTTKISESLETLLEFNDLKKIT